MPFPLDRWRKESPTAVLETVAGGIDVRTPSGDYEYTMAYPPLTAPVTGRYRFALRYADSVGGFAFGAFPSDNSRWLAVSTVGYRDGDAREIAFTVELKAGDAVYLALEDGQVVLRSAQGGWTESSRGLGAEMWRQVGGADAIERERDSWE